VASVGGHPIAVVCGAYARDTAQIFDHFPFDEEAVADQARAVLEDLPVQAIKVGFVGSPENISAIAEITADYDEIPVIAYMPNLSWWRDELIDEYLDAFRELLLPQTSVLVGNHSTLWRWLLPDWSGARNPTARDIARAASEMGVPYTLVTGIPLPEQFVENVLASPQTVLGSGKFELFDATFSGAGDTLSAAITALVGAGNDLGEATSEALSYLDRCLDAGFRPGMGHIVPDRMFWAQPDDGDDEDDDDDEQAGAGQSTAATLNETQALEGFVMPPHDTKH
jgi:hydroxymethylpyrimidine/phosphomethylpyrimidine kinase